MTHYRVEAMFCGSWIPVANIAAKSSKGAVQTAHRKSPANIRQCKQWRTVTIGNVSGRNLGKITHHNP